MFETVGSTLLKSHVKTLCTNILVTSNSYAVVFFSFWNVFPDFALLCFFLAMLQYWQYIHIVYIQLAAVEGGYDSLVQLSILSSCSFDSCRHHVDSTYPRGPFGFVQLLLLCCPGWWSVRVLQQRRRARAHIIFYTQHGLNECTRDSWCMRKGKRSSRE